MTKQTKKATRETSKRILDLETGESIPIEEGDKLVRAASTKAYREKKKKEEKKQKDRKTSLLTQGTFVQVLHNKGKKIEKDLKLSECYTLLRLFFCVDQHSKNYLVHMSGENKGQKMNVTDISLYLGKSERQTRRDLNRLVELNALKCVNNPKNKTEKFYSLNSKFFTATTREDEDATIGFTKVFHKKLGEVHSKLTTNQFGALLKFMRNFHHQTYYLVEDPDWNIIINPELSIAKNLLLEENEGVLQHLNQTQLANIIGTSEESIKHYVKAFEKAGVMIKIEQNKSYRFIIHPDLMFRKDEDGQDEYSDTIRTQFLQFTGKKKKTTKKKR